MTNIPSLVFDDIYRDLRDAIATSLDATRCHFIGIERGGMWLAGRLYRELVENSSRASKHSKLGSLNIAFHRDDYQQRIINPLVQPSNIPFSIDNQQVLLIDDVLMTGRTIRAALNEIFDFGRPTAIRFACLIDIGMRELPIRPDYCGKTIQIPPHSRIRLSISEDKPRLETMAMTPLVAKTSNIP